jgi:hypothetical protein
MYCHMCGKQVPENGHFCQNCGAKQSEENIAQPNIGTDLADSLTAFLNSANAKQLYDRAYDYHDSGESAKFEQVCKFLLNKFPNSEEAKWALENFPITLDNGSKTVSLGQKNTDVTAKTICGILGSILLFVSLVAGMTAFYRGAETHFLKIEFTVIGVLAALTMVLSLAKKFEGLWLTGFAALAISLEILVKYWEVIQLGWAVLFIGTCFLFAAASIRRVTR